MSNGFNGAVRHIPIRNIPFPLAPHPPSSPTNFRFFANVSFAREKIIFFKNTGVIVVATVFIIITGQSSPVFNYRPQRRKERTAFVMFQLNSHRVSTASGSHSRKQRYFYSITVHQIVPLCLLNVLNARARCSYKYFNCTCRGWK